MEGGHATKWRRPWASPGPRKGGLHRYVCLQHFLLCFPQNLMIAPHRNDESISLRPGLLVVGVAGGDSWAPVSLVPSQ
jgi:hypothetical protein